MGIIGSILTVILIGFLLIFLVVMIIPCALYLFLVLAEMFDW